ncbi:DUF6221 family protein [Streptomyces sp. NPDC059104]|uniref:DUF6221 family protein n=1 Tax=Streptomyces sp. NPDC059104 TaxID=3346729 RepID=UPI0036BA73D5
MLPVSGWVHTAPAPSHEWQHPGTDHHVASVPLDSDRAHIVRHDPARVLAEVDAKRQVLAHIEAQLDRTDTPWWFDDTLTPVLHLLALPYAGHPDYRKDWRPDT